jgi:hypothetical protein
VEVTTTAAARWIRWVLLGFGRAGCRFRLVDWVREVGSFWILAYGDDEATCRMRTWTSKCRPSQEYSNCTFFLQKQFHFLNKYFLVVFLSQ